MAYDPNKAWKERFKVWAKDDGYNVEPTGLGTFLWPATQSAYLGWMAALSAYPPFDFSAETIDGLHKGMAYWMAEAQQRSDQREEFLKRGYQYLGIDSSGSELKSELVLLELSLLELAKLSTFTRLSDPEIDKVAASMPGGVGGFLKTWGWLQFAKALEDALIECNSPDKKYSVPPLDEDQLVTVVNQLASKDTFDPWVGIGVTIKHNDPLLNLDGEFNIAQLEVLLSNLKRTKVQKDLNLSTNQDLSHD